VFVSLEPCRHQGKTPPCTGALLEAGVSRVVYGASDPGVESGGGAAVLAANGVEVVGPGLAEVEARWENPVFFHRESERPWTALKLAVSLDARIAAKPGEGGTLSGVEALEEVQRLRAGFDAILVGTRTALVDDPRLTVRGPIVPRVEPRRILLDARGRIGPEARIFREGAGEVWILTTPASPAPWRRRLEESGARVLEVSETENGRIDMGRAMRELRRHAVGSLLCEGGGELAVSLLRDELVDRLYLALVPEFLGEGGVRAFPGLSMRVPADSLGGGWRFGEPPRQLGRDLWLALRPSSSEEEG